MVPKQIVELWVTAACGQYRSNPKTYGNQKHRSERITRNPWAYTLQYQNDGHIAKSLCLRRQFVAVQPDGGSTTGGGGEPATRVVRVWAAGADSRSGAAGERRGGTASRPAFFFQELRDDR
jgi:hypothetical protein